MIIIVCQQQRNVGPWNSGSFVSSFMQKSPPSSASQPSEQPPPGFNMHNNVLAWDGMMVRHNIMMADRLLCATCTNNNNTRTRWDTKQKARIAASSHGWFCMVAGKCRVIFIMAFRRIQVNCSAFIISSSSIIHPPTLKGIFPAQKQIVVRRGTHGMRQREGGFGVA